MAKYLIRQQLVLSRTAAGVVRSDWLSPRPLFAQSEDDKETVRARRRRRTTTSPGERERAKAPRRQTGGTQHPPSGGAPPSGGGGSSMRPPQFPSGGGGGMSPLLLILLAVAAVIIIPLFLFFSGGGDDGAPSDSNDVVQQPVQDIPAESSSSSSGESASGPINDFTPPAMSASGQTWLVMLYQDADDKILEQDIHLDLNEVERVGSTDRVQIVAQLDRYRGGFSGDGNWASARRYFVTRDNDLNRINSPVLDDLGEVNMADGQTLVDFATWAIENFPADRYVLILSDHGIGWPGGWSDPDPRSSGDPSVPLARVLGDQLYLSELDDALEAIRRETGIGQLELLGMDACLMGHLEVFSALAPHARYAVASQEVEPALGWAYAGFLEELVRNPDMDGAQLSTAIVDNYIVSDQRIVDDQARQEMVSGRGLSGLFGLFSEPTAEEMAQQLGRGVTLTAVDLSVMPDLVSTVNDFAYLLQDEQQPVVAQARSYAQSYTSVFGNEVPPSYIDLGHFVQLLQQRGGDTAVNQTGDFILQALDRAIVAEKHGPDKPGATGISIYFPNSQLYRSVAGPESYTALANRFASVSLWDDFLTYHYTGRPFDANAPTLSVPDASATIRAPGSGEIRVTPVEASDAVAAPGQPVLLSADISGDNIGYIYFFAGFYDSAANSLFVADSDFLESSDTRELNGVYYPVWPERTFTLEFEWEPLYFAIDDGAQSVVALFNPESYGASPEEAIYTIDGIYTYTDGEQRPARLVFQDGVLRQVFGFTSGAPREIIPEPGDSFTVSERWMDLDSNGRVRQTTTQEGGTLTFGDQTFTQIELDAAVGEYLVGFIVTDLDGNSTPMFTRINVE